ncbi:AMP-binding protein [Thioclava pacifica]|uniref:AMP-binding protein n=1 Tax=Thioclava pacifica TaxID=285109 RepID=UPI00146F9B66|nr:AMP-binding protein [Thioclava pacifica]
MASLRGYCLSLVRPELMQAAGQEFDLVLSDQERSADPRYLTIMPDWFAMMGAQPQTDFRDQGGAARFIFGSSGSTGRAKLICSEEADREETMRQTHPLPGVDISTRRYLSTLPPSNGMGLNSYLWVLINGGSAVALDPQSPSLLPYIDLYRVDTIGSTPGMIPKLLREANAAQYLSGVRDVRFGGALSSAELLDAFSKICPARLHFGYGAAEIGTCFHAQYDPATPPEMGYVGRPARSDLEVAFFDEGGVRREEASEGLIGLRLAGAAARQYLGDTSQAVDSGSGFRDGYFLPGDFMRRENDDFFLIGRTKNIINFSGNKVSLETIQQLLEAAFPDTSFAPLVDSGADGLERIFLIYSGSSEHDTGQITALFEQAFRGIEISRLLRLDALPMTESGKVDFEALREAHLGRGAG